MNDLLMPRYKKLDCLDKKHKPLILDWLCGLFDYKDYPHSFQDQYINWGIWDGKLDISFDGRCQSQMVLLSKIHPRFLGSPQYKTLKIVNEKTFYLDIEKIGEIKYPTIEKSILLFTAKHKDNDGDTFYTYDWEVFLSDNTSIEYHNQKNIMDMKHRNFIYDSTIQERFFTNFIASRQDH